MEIMPYSIIYCFYGGKEDPDVVLRRRGSFKGHNYFIAVGEAVQCSRG